MIATETRSSEPRWGRSANILQSLPGLLDADLVNHGWLQAACKLGISWQALPSRVQRNLYLKYLDQPADAGLLPYFRKMVERSDYDSRLTGTCVKLHYEKELYSEAYRVLELCLLKRTQQILRASQDAIVKSELYAYISDIRLLIFLWDRLDLETKRDTAAKHRACGDVRGLFALIARESDALMRDLPLTAQGKFFSAFLELAELTGIEQHIVEVHAMFMRSSARNDLGIYQSFITNIVRPAQFKNAPARERYLSEFVKWLDELLPDESACWELIAREEYIPAAPPKPPKPGRPPKLAKPPKWNLRIFDSLLSALELAGRTEMSRRLAEKLLERADQPDRVITLCSRLLKCRDNEVKLLAARRLRSLPGEAALTDAVTFAIAFLLLNDREQLLALHKRGLLEDVPNLSVSGIAEIYSHIGDIGTAIARVACARSESLQAFATDGNLDALKVLLQTPQILDNLRFLKESSDILNQVPQPSAPEGLLVLVAKDASEVNVFPLLALRELKQRGFAMVPLVSGVMEYQPTGIADIDDVAGQLRPGMNFTRWQEHTGAGSSNEWLFDYGARKITYRGVDLFWGVREELCCRDRRYSIDFRSPVTQAVITDFKQRAELFALCLDKIAEIGKRLNLPIRIAVPYIHLGVNYFARRYVQKLSEKQDISLIHASMAYENYFTNFSTEASTTMAVQDMTRQAELSQAFFAPRPWFDRYYESVPDKEQERDRVLHWIRQNRVGRKDGGGKSARLEFLQAERRRGKKIVALFGKVLFDMWMPRGDGAVHADMRDWFDHTVAIASRNESVHLVIKPHPHEIRDEIALYPTEVLKDWLPQPLPLNIHFLAHDELNLFELADVLDLALLWNGMSALELGVMGIPTILGAYYGAIDYPVGHIAVGSRDHYEQLIVSGEKVHVPTGVGLRSAALINYLRHPDISTPYRYTCRGLTNRHIRNLRWFSEDLDAYYANGDPNVTLLADRIAGTGAEIEASVGEQVPTGVRAAERRRVAVTAASGV